MAEGVLPCVQERSIVLEQEEGSRASPNSWARSEADLRRSPQYSTRMEPMTYFYESIDRNAILVRPRQPYIDWANKVYNDGHAFTGRDECNIYLVRERGSNEEVERWVRKHFDELFVNELNDWCTDEERWPPGRTYKMFADWFTVEVHSMVLDVEEGPITKE